MKKTLIVLWLFIQPLFIFAQASGGQIRRPVKNKTDAKNSLTKQKSANKKSTQYSIPKAVDLGLPSGTLWADRNLGANSPEEKGYEYFWGDVSPTRSATDFRYCCGIGCYSKYNMEDGKKSLEKEDDAAYMNLGKGWHVPSYEQIKELTNTSYTETEWATVSGIDGLKIKSRINGASIFLPTSINTSSWGYYWSSDKFDDNEEHTFPDSNAYSLVFSKEKGILFRASGQRNIGRNIRPVFTNR